MAGLRRHRADQAAFARHARAIADAVAVMLAGPSGLVASRQAGDEADAATSRFALLGDYHVEPEAATALEPEPAGSNPVSYLSCPAPTPN